MHLFVLLGCFLLAAECVLSSAHIPEEGAPTSRVVLSNTLSQSVDTDSSSVVIVELPKSGRKNKKTKKPKKNKFGAKKRPPPPAGCIPLWESCKTSGKVCCDFCAFCQCRIFRTVCYCRMGNPRC